MCKSVHKPLADVRQVPEATPRPAWQQVAIRRRFIAHQYRRPRPPLADLRLKELQRVLHDHHHGPVLSDDDAGRDDLWLLLHHFAAAASEGFELADVAEAIGKHAPWLPQREAAALAKRVTSRRRYIMGADDLGKRLGLAMAKRTALKITTIGACDVTKAQRAKLRKHKAMMRERQRRATAGATPRFQSLERTRPWEEEGISRRTWFRRQKQAADGTAGTVSCAAIFISTANEAVPQPCPDQTAQPVAANGLCNLVHHLTTARTQHHRPRGDNEAVARVERADAVFDHDAPPPPTRRRFAEARRQP